MDSSGPEEPRGGCKGRAGRESSGLVNGFAAQGTSRPAGALTYKQTDSVNI